MSNNLQIEKNELEKQQSRELIIFNEAKNRSNQTIERFADAVFALDVVEKAYNSKNDIRLIADLTPEMKKAIREGTKKLDVSGEKIYAQLRDKTGRWSDKITLKELPADVIVDPIALSTAMQMKTIEKKLDEIVDVLKLMSADIDTVRIGQENDRIALFYSGMDLFRESEKVLNPALRELISSQAIANLSDSNSQEVESIKTDIHYLVSKKHLELPKGKIMDEVNRRMKSINKCLEIIHKCNFAKAAIYYKKGEIEAMLEVFDEYGRFVKDTIAPNVGILAEIDSNEKSIDGSKWAYYVKSLKNISDIREQLEKNKPIYIEGDSIHV